MQVEVKDPPQGVTPPTQNTPKKMGHQPNKVRPETVFKPSAAVSCDGLSGVMYMSPGGRCLGPDVGSWRACPSLKG